MSNNQEYLVSPRGPAIVITCLFYMSLATPTAKVGVAKLM